MGIDAKVILITGSSTGFGRIAAESLARAGHTVFASMRGVEGKNKDNAAALRTLAANDGLKLEVVDLDVTDESSIAGAVSTVIDKAGRLDVLVNNAGIAGMGVGEAYTDEQARRIFDVNVFGAVNTARGVLPQMREQRSGLIITISSGLGRIVLPGMAVYNASKFAVEGYFETLRLETAALGVDSVLVEPGAFETEIFGNMIEPAERDRAAGYEHLADLPEQMSAGMGEYFKSAEAGSPQDVVDAVITLINAEPSMRPTRTVVGADVQPVNELNATAADVQKRLLEGFGMAPFVDAVR